MVGSAPGGWQPRPADMVLIGLSTWARGSPSYREDIDPGPREMLAVTADRSGFAAVG